MSSAHNVHAVRSGLNLTVVGTTHLPFPDPGRSLLDALGKAHAHAGVADEADTVVCPECGARAGVEWRSVRASTSGPVEHVKVRCPDGHWFLLPAAWLEGEPADGQSA
jgi:hypothetical protein